MNEYKWVCYKQQCPLQIKQPTYLFNFHRMVCRIYRCTNHLNTLHQTIELNWKKPQDIQLEQDPPRTHAPLCSSRQYLSQPSGPPSSVQVTSVALVVVAGLALTRANKATSSMRRTRNCMVVRNRWFSEVWWWETEDGVAEPNTFYLFPTVNCRWAMVVYLVHRYFDHGLNWVGFRNSCSKFKGEVVEALR